MPDALPPLLRKVQTDCMESSSGQQLWWHDPRQKKLVGHHLPTGEKKQYDIPLRFIMDRKGNLLFNGNGLLYLDTQTGQLTKMGRKMEQTDTTGIVKNSKFNAYGADPLGRFWIGTIRNGLLMYDPGKDSLHIFQHQPDNPNSPPKGVISAIHIGINGWVYFRADAGLGIYKPEEDTFYNIDMTDGYQRHRVPPLMEDGQQRLWFGSKEGLSRLDTDDMTITTFDESDGLSHGSFDNGVSGKDALGYLYFSKNGKLFRFHPDSVQLKDYIAPIILTDFYLDRQKTELGEKDSLLKKTITYQKDLVLDHHQTNFGFRFVSPTFYKADRIQYYYQLEGYHSDWVSAGSQLEAHFTNIPAGQYRFKVKAQSVAGTWAELKSPIHITVLPPWWETWWAYLLYVLSALALVYYIYQDQLRKRLAESESSRLKEMDELKTKLYTNITHEFRTPLTVILGMSDQIKEGQTEVRQLIRRNSKNLLHLVNQLLDMSKLESQKMQLSLVQCNIVSYLRYLTQSFESYSAIKQIELVFETELHELVMDFDPDKIQHIIANLLSNAIKFTQEKGRVALSVSEGPRQGKAAYQPLVKIKVSDNGMGIQAEHLPHLFDRFFQVDASVTRSVDGTGIGWLWPRN